MGKDDTDSQCNFARLKILLPNVHIKKLRETRIGAKYNCSILSNKSLIDQSIYQHPHYFT